MDMAHLHERRDALPIFDVSVTDRPVSVSPHQGAIASPCSTLRMLPGRVRLNTEGAARGSETRRPSRPACPSARSCSPAVSRVGVLHRSASDASTLGLITMSADLVMRNAAVMVVEGVPVPAPKITTRPFSRWRGASADIRLGDGAHLDGGHHARHAPLSSEACTASA